MAETYPDVYGTVPANTYKPQLEQGYTWDVWISAVATAMAKNIVYDTGAGYPAGWDKNRLGTYDMDIGRGIRNPSDANISAGSMAKLVQYLQEYEPGKDSWIDRNFPMPPRETAQRVETPEAMAFRIANERWEAEYGLDERRVGVSEGSLALSERQQQFVEDKFAIELAMANAENQIRRAASSGGGSSGVSSRAQMLMAQSEIALQKAALEMEERVANRQLDIQQEGMDIDRMYKEALVQNMQAQQQLGQQQLAQDRERMQMEAALTLRAQQQERGNTIAELSAGGGADAVQREYMLRNKPEPVGTFTDIFSGETGGMGTLSQIMQQQAPLVQQNIQAGMSGQQAPVPGMAMGTGLSGMARQRFGYTREPEFIVGDSVSGQRTGFEEVIRNPTNAPIQVEPLNNPRLSDMMLRGRGR